MGAPAGAGEDGAVTAPLDVRRAEAVAELTLANPRRRNALSFDLLGALGEEVADEAAAGTRAAVLTGAGGCFSAGADLRDLDGTIADLAYDAALAETTAALAAAPFPVIAAIEGACVGAGFGLAMACDVRVASRTAFFEIPAARLGLLYSPPATATLHRRLGSQTLARLLLVGERLDAGAGAAAGIVARVVEAGAALTAARGLAAAAAGNPPGAVGATKRLLGDLDRDVFDAAGWNAVQSEILASPERRSAVAAAKAGRGRAGGATP